MKKLLASVFVLLLLVSCCIIAAFPASASDVNYDDFFIDNGIIIEYTGSDADLVIPSVDAEGNPITSIASRAFEKNKDLNSVVIPEGITELGMNAFGECSNLTEVSLPYSLKKSESGVLRKTALLSLTVPAQLKDVPNDFVSGLSVTELFISPGVETIASGAFNVAVSEVIFPSSVYKIGGAFWSDIPAPVSELSIYILNPDCILGQINEKHPLYEKFGSPAPLAIRTVKWKPQIKIYAPRDAADIKEYVKTVCNDNMTNFIGLSDEQIATLEAQCKENGIMEPTVDPSTQDPTDDPDDAKDDDKKTDNDKGTGLLSGGGDNKMLIVLIAVIGGFFFLIIIGLVVLVIVMNNNKKKKKKKKKAKKVAEALEKEIVEKAPVEEAVEKATEVAEETGEEE